MAIEGGTIIAKVALDDKGLKTSLDGVKTKGKRTASDIEKAWKSMGKKSDQTYDQMKANIEKNYNIIKNHAQSTAADIVRAEKAKAQKIEQINKQQFGEQHKHLNKLKENWKSYGLVAVATVTGIAYAAKGIAEASIKSASDLQEVQSKFDVVFAGQKAQAEGWAKTLVDSYAMSTREAKQYLSSVQDLLVPMGMASDKAGIMSNEVVKLAADLGSFNNLPTAQVMENIQSALTGEYESMKKYGVVLNATTVQQKALNMGLADTKDELTAGMKAQAAYALMVEGSTAAIGDMDRTSQNYANQMKKFLANMEDLKAMLGEELLPAVTDVVIQINGWVEANKELIGQNAHEAIDKIKASVERIVTAYNALPDGVIGAAGTGIIARVLTGSTPLGTAVGLMYLLNEQLKYFGLNLGGIGGKYRGLNENLANIWGVLTGKLDPNTGLPKKISGAGRGFGALPPPQPPPPQPPPPTPTGGGGKAGYVPSLQEYDKLLDQLRFQKSLLGETETVQRAMTLARQNDIAITNAQTGAYTEQFKEILSLVEEYNAQVSAQEAEKEATARRLEIISDFNSQYADLGKSQVELERERIREQAKIWEMAGADKVQVAEWTAEKLKEISGNEFSAITEFGVQAAHNIQDAFSDFFYDAFTGELDSAKDYLKAFTEAITRTWANMLSQMLMESIKTESLMAGMKGIGGFLSGVFGGLFGGATGAAGATSFVVAHAGGEVGFDSFPTRTLASSYLYSAPRLHNGLMPDEFPAILQRGETVIPRGKQETQKETVNYNIVIQAVDAKSFSDLTRRNPQAIIGPIVSAINDNDPSLRTSIRTAIGR